MVPLIKIDPDAPDLELPCRLMQLIPRKWYNFMPEETEKSLNQVVGTEVSGVRISNARKI